MNGVPASASGSKDMTRQQRRYRQLPEGSVRVRSEGVRGGTDVPVTGSPAGEGLEWD